MLQNQCILLKSLKWLNSHINAYMLLLFSRWAVSNSLWPHGLQHTRLLCPSLSPGVCSNSCFTESVMPSSATPFSSCPQSFPASGSFPISWLFASGVQNIGTSASVSLLPMNIPSWFPLGLTSLISLQSKILSRVFESNSYSALSLLYGPTLTSVHDCWKNHSCDYTDLCQQSDVSAF